VIALLMGLKTISPAALHELLREATVLDVNAPGSWARARVPGARALDGAAFTERDLPADKDSLLVFYCSNPLCRKAPNAAKRATAMGYRQVRVLSAGISGWLSAGLPTQSGEAETLK
jgi:rhodanese-related sulfurtransferase